MAPLVAGFQIESGNGVQMLEGELLCQGKLIIPSIHDELGSGDV